MLHSISHVCLEQALGGGSTRQQTPRQCHKAAASALACETSWLGTMARQWWHLPHVGSTTISVCYPKLQNSTSLAQLFVGTSELAGCLFSEAADNTGIHDVFVLMSVSGQRGQREDAGGCCR